MLTQLELQYFKCFEILRLPLGSITLLSGTNSSGKSSVLQSLTLLHQTIRDHEWSTRLMLNGSALRLGTLADVVDKVHGRYQCDIGVTSDGVRYRWSFAGRERSDMSMRVERVSIAERGFEHPETLHNLLPQDDGAGVTLTEQLRRLTYLSAERVGPRDVYDLEDASAETRVGRNGEAAVGVLYMGRDEPVLDELTSPLAPPTLLNQVQERMREFFPGCSLAFDPIPRANAVSLSFRTSDETDPHRPTNVGFGITQVLPIIVAAMSARRGDLLLVENPEVHLHPAGQAAMGRFLATVATTGIQVILETHSDHLLNGLRRAVKAAVITPDQVAIHFFSTAPAPTQVVSPVIDANGALDSWPDGFFDQFDKDANHFADWDH